MNKSEGQSPMDNPNEDKGGSIANPLDCLCEKFGWTAAMIRFVETWDDRNARKGYLMQNNPEYGLHSPGGTVKRNYSDAHDSRSTIRSHINNLSRMTAFIEHHRSIRINVYKGLNAVPGVVSAQRTLPIKLRARLMMSYILQVNLIAHSL